MPLDGSAKTTALARLEQENPELVLKHAMFEVRPPVTKIVGRLMPRAAGRLLFLPVSGSGGSDIKAFAEPITKKEVTALVGLCRDSKRLMAQNAELVPDGWSCPHREFRVNNIPYYSPHGFIDYYVREALGAYHGCKQALEPKALIYLGFLEKQHRAIYRLRRNAHEQEREFEVLLDAA